jgi:hypothetical protein
MRRPLAALPARIVAKIVAEYIARLEAPFESWRNRLAFVDAFKISRAESGFLCSRTCWNWKTTGGRWSSASPNSAPTSCGRRWRTSSCAWRFPAALQKSMAERLYLEDVKAASSSAVHAGADGKGVGQSQERTAVISSTGRASTAAANLPLIYMATSRIRPGHGSPACRQERQAQREG